MSLKESLLEFIADPKTLQECYAALPQYEQHSIRARIYENLGKAFKRIAKGVYIASDGKTQALLLEGDAWERIRDIETDSINFIITDPPYSTAKRWAQIGGSRKGDYGFAYHDLDKTMYDELARVLKRGGHCFIFLSADTEHTLPYNEGQVRLAQDAGFIFNKRFIWNKVSMGMGYNGRNQYENILFLSKGKRHKPYDLSVRDVLTHKKVSVAARQHETEKPIPLLRDLLRFCAKPGDIGLDPFAGSHNFIKACQTRSCHSVTIECDPAMVAAAIERFGARPLIKAGETLDQLEEAA